MDKRSQRARLGAVILGHAQALGTLVFAITLGVSSQHTSGWTMPGQKLSVSVSLVVEYLIFAAGIEVATLGVQRRRQWARTPFVLVQLFMVIAVGLTLIESGSAVYTAAGAVITAIAVAAAVLAILGSLNASAGIDDLTGLDDGAA